MLVRHRIKQKKLRIEAPKAEWYEYILPQFLTFLTGKRRDRVENIEWNPNLWSQNAFRLWEFIFWRRYGIRPESSLTLHPDGEVVYQFHSWEALIVHFEIGLRSIFRLPKLKFVKIWIPVLANTRGLPMPSSPYLFAIAFVRTSTSLNPASNTVAFDATGTNGYLVVQTLKASSQTVSGVTYNGVAMTLIVGPIAGQPSTQTDYLWGLAAPTTGSNNIVVSDSGAGTLVVDATLYSGAQQTTAVEATGTNSGTATPTTVSVTTITDNAWLVGWFRAGGDASAFTAGSNTVVRTDAAEGPRQMVDTGVDQTPAGSKTMTATYTGTGDWSSMAFSLKPTASVAHTAVGTETMSLSETLAQVFKATVGVSDQLNLSEDLLTTSQFAQSIVEQLNFSDTVQAINIILVEVTDQMNLSETGEQQTTYALVLTDQANLSDALSISQGQTVSIIEQINLTDQASLLQVISVLLQETLNLSETLSAVMPGWSFREKRTTAWTSRSKNTSVWTFRTKNETES